MEKTPQTETEITPQYLKDTGWKQQGTYTWFKRGAHCDYTYTFALYPFHETFSKGLSGKPYRIETVERLEQYLRHKPRKRRDGRKPDSITEDRLKENGWVFKEGHGHWHKEVNRSNFKVVSTATLWTVSRDKRPPVYVHTIDALERYTQRL